MPPPVCQNYSLQGFKTEKFTVKPAQSADYQDIYHAQVAVQTEQLTGQCQVSQPKFFGLFVILC